jgi:carbonic anhydrase
MVAVERDGRYRRHVSIGGSSYDHEWWLPTSGTLFPPTDGGHGGAGDDGSGGAAPVLGHVSGRESDLSRFPRLGWAIVTCMDTRVDIGRLFGGIGPADAHVIRNAGGVVTDDTIRSLAISQRLGSTSSIFLVHHTDCALLTITDPSFARALSQQTGRTPTWSAGAFTDLDDDVRASMAKVEASLFLPRRHAVRGFVFDVATGNLREVGRQERARH